MRMILWFCDKITPKTDKLPKILTTSLTRLRLVVFLHFTAASSTQINSHFPSQLFENPTILARFNNLAD